LCSIQGVVCRFQGALEISDGHADLGLSLAAQCSGEFGSANGGSSSKTNRLGVLPQILARIEKPVDPFVEPQRVCIDRGLGELLELVIALAFLIEKELQRFVALLGVGCFLGGLEYTPAHFLGDNLVPVRVIHVGLEKFEVFLGVSVLLLEEALPHILVPSLLGFKIIVVFRHQ
jgi:hypothetical protein